MARRNKREKQAASAPADAGRGETVESPPAPDEERTSSRIEAARLYRERGQYVQAIGELEAERTEFPDDVTTLVELGATLLAAGRPADGERELRRALRLDPERGDAHHFLGVVLFKRGLYRPAVTALKRAIELDDRNGESYFYLGEGLNQLGEVDPALAALERAIQFHPTNARAYFTMGILYDRKHLRQEATTMYRKARELGAA